MPDSWIIRNFTEANPKGAGQGDVPSLLRRVADSIESFDKIDVQDLTFATEITEDGPCYSVTVYFHLPGTDDGVEPEEPGLLQSDSPGG